MELTSCGRQEISAPKKLGLDLQLDGESGANITPAADGQVWLDKVQELAHRGITARQLLGFYADLGGEVMKHFDPDRSTTHDVVRQAIIPESLQIKDVGSFMVRVHRATGLAALDLLSASDPYCVVSVQGRGF